MQDPDVVSDTPTSRRRIVGYNPSLSLFSMCVVLGAIVLNMVETAAQH